MNNISLEINKDNVSECFDVNFKDEVAHIVLSRPEKRNSMNWSFWKDLPNIIKEIDNNVMAKCIVISSTGSVFSAGIDLSLFGYSVFTSSLESQGSDKELQKPQLFMNFLSFLQDSISSLQEARIPVICAIQGACIGGGVDLICAADIRLATKDAYFCIKETKIGMVADVGTFPRIVKLMPEGIVKELAFTGRDFSASEAKEHGLINHLYDDHKELVREAIKLAKEIAKNSPAAVYGCKRVIDYSRDHSIEESLDWINMWNSSMFSINELQKGFKAIKSKTDGNFADLPKIKNYQLKE
tara:strand:- start:795 stop:1688 length:894 start_codon:yes stop_codon:yes gene_type:complete